MSPLERQVWAATFASSLTLFAMNNDPEDAPPDLGFKCARAGDYAVQLLRMALASDQAEQLLIVQEAPPEGPT